MATRLQIANGALVKLGARTISSLSGTDKESRLCNERFDSCRKALLRLYPWQFAIVRATLDTVTSTPEFGYSNAFTLPTGCLRVVTVNEGDEQYRVEGGLLLSDASEVRLRYVADYDTDEEFVDPLFCEALSLYLAWDIAYALTQSSETQDRMWILFNKMVPFARHTGSTEHGAQIVEANDFVESRMSRSRFVRDPGT